MSDVVIRSAGAADLPAVAELRWRWLEQARGTPDVDLADFVPRFVAWGRENTASHHCFVAVRGEAVIGMAWLAVTPRVPYPDAFDRASGDVQCVYLLPEHRDGGLGGRLVEAVLALAGELGLERVSVHSNDRAVAAYSRYGFAVSPRLLQAVPGA